MESEDSSYSESQNYDFEKILANCLCQEQEEFLNKDWMEVVGYSPQNDSEDFLSQCLNKKCEKSKKSGKIGNNPNLIEKRNQRERSRVKAVNESFNRLRRLIPSLKSRDKRVSKVKTLHKALEYIRDLKTLLENYDRYKTEL